MQTKDITPEVRKAIDTVTAQFSDKGKVVEMGWLALRKVAIPPDASDTQIREMRKAFFAGAQHLFASINVVLDSDREPTEKDLRRVTLIYEELKAFTKELSAEISDS